MPTNFIPLYLPLELLVVINERSGKAKQGNSTFIMRLLIEHYKDKIIPKFGEEVYKELHEKYSKDVLTQKKEKLEDKKARQAKTEKRLKLRAKALELKERELKIREANTGIRTERTESEKLSRKVKCEQLSEKRELWRKNLAEQPYSRYASNWKTLLKKVEDEMRALGCEMT